LVTRKRGRVAVIDSPEGGQIHMNAVAAIEITTTSPVGFEDAITQGIHRAGDTLENTKSAWVADQQMLVSDGQISGYRVVLHDDDD
jgi:flavin-binding protein dodecin